MTHATSLPQSANAFWKLPERIELDEGQRAEQFAAFLRARVSERSRAPELAPAHSKGLPALPARSRSADNSTGAVAPHNTPGLTRFRVAVYPRSASRTKRGRRG